MLSLLQPSSITPLVPISFCVLDGWYVLSWRTFVVVYKKSTIQPQSFKAVDFTQLVCSDVLFAQTQINFPIRFRFVKKDITLLAYP